MYTEDMELEREDDKTMTVYEVKMVNQDPVRFRSDENIKCDLEGAFIIISEEYSRTLFICRATDFEYFCLIDEAIL